MEHPHKNDQIYALFWAKKIKAIRLLGGKCKKCNNDDIFVLEFHHIDSKTKKGEINSFLQSKKKCSSKWSEIEKELNKCELLCRNCHAELHHPMSHPLKEKLLELKGYDNCSKCGYKGKSSASLDFHHRNREEKKFKLSDKYYRYTLKRFILPLETIIIELDKCDILCRNCHTLEIINMPKFDRLKKKIYYKTENYVEIDNWDTEKLKKMYNEGYVYPKIASKLGCSRFTVMNLIKKMLSDKSLKKRSSKIVKRKPLPKSKFYKKRYKMEKMYLDGMIIKEIASIMNCDNKTVLNIMELLRKEGRDVPMRYRRRNLK
ncbi:MAG: hypothetical protein HOG49_32075 [Candidatus Scalindua sp.]|jgi:transposase|nr:hypothetical protein [Candidatus Scalindua sp.]